MRPSPVSLESLPPEVFLHVLPFLPLTSLPGLLLVSKHLFHLVAPSIYDLTCSVHSVALPRSHELIESGDVSRWLSAFRNVRTLAREHLCTSPYVREHINVRCLGHLSIKDGQMIFDGEATLADGSAELCRGIYRVDLGEAELAISLVMTLEEGTDHVQAIILDKESVGVAWEGGVGRWRVDGGVRELHRSNSPSEVLLQLKSKDATLAAAYGSEGGVSVALLDWRSGELLAKVNLAKVDLLSPFTVELIRSDVLFTYCGGTPAKPYDTRAAYHILKRSSSNQECSVVNIDLTESLSGSAHWMNPYSSYLPRIEELDELPRGTVASMLSGGLRGSGEWWMSSEFDLDPEMTGNVSYVDPLVAGQASQAEFGPSYRPFSNPSGHRCLLSQYRDGVKHFFMWETSPRLVRQAFDELKQGAESPLDFSRINRHPPLAPVSLEGVTSNRAKLPSCRVRAGVRLVAEVKSEEIVRVLRRSEGAILEERGRWLAAAPKGEGIYLWKLGSDQ